MTVSVAPTDRSLRHRFRAMNTDVTLELLDPQPHAPQAIAEAEKVFRTVEASCTRFDPDSALMRANAAGQEWATVPAECFSAIWEAAHAHADTDGLFDPRVLGALVGLGYDRTLPFGTGPVEVASGSRPTDVPVARAATAAAPSAAGASGGPWTPELDADRLAVRIGPSPIDLGGIGKGLAVRWASMVLADAGSSFLVEAGGDCSLGGWGPDSIGWKVGVEDPHGGDEPVAVLQLANTACATSSLRKRTWSRDGQQFHHIVDPRTGTSAAGGLRSVTVVDADPARAEVWSKSLLIVGRDGVRALAQSRGIAAVWVHDDGSLEATDGVRPALIWSVRDVG